MSLSSDAYIAGLIEGDGSITWNGKDCGVLEHSAIDFDLVQRTALRIDRPVRVLTTPTMVDKLARGHKQLYKTVVSGKKALEVLKDLYPYFWSHRRDQIEHRFGYRNNSISVASPSLEWLAGLLDAEGCFLFQHTPIIQLKMTDEDVVMAVRDTFSPDSIIHKREDTRKSTYKDIYSLYICGDRATKLMESLFTHLCVRKQNQIIGVLSYRR
jgi:Txe/YoeB family toxin of Txe-Axe toxin-antitoxin module